MVNSYNGYKVKSLKAKRYTLQSSTLRILEKTGSITTTTSPKHSYSTYTDLSFIIADEIPKV